MSRRLLATVKDHATRRCARVYRDTVLRQYVVVFTVGRDEALPEHRTDSREDAYVTAWGFVWPKDP